MKIPYAMCDFASIRTESFFYVDKTPFLPQLERISGRYLIFLRPRRFGKSTLLSTLANYYDIALADRFDELFAGLWIHASPTPEKNKYLILRLDFSPVSTEGDIAGVRRSFASQVKSSLSSFVNRYVHLVPKLSKLEESLLDKSNDDTAALMTRLLSTVGDAGHQVYLLIDEYDHFGNRLLSDNQMEVYRDSVRSAGFVRSFYAALKAFTATSTLARMFVTGVSPIMLDDLSSGFNIITHISQRDEFNALLGFTRTDVERAMDTLLADMPALAQDPRIGDREALLTTMKSYYDGYRFSVNATEHMYNSTLVLYFIEQLKSSGRYPRQMLDLNVRTDYGRLYAIARAASGLELGTRELLVQVLTEGYVINPLVEQFGTRAPFRQAQLASLFYYMGMLTYAEDAADYEIPKLVIPNRVMHELQWGYMAFALEDHDDIRIDMSGMEVALMHMSVHGNIQPLLDLFHKEVVKRLGLRELLKFDEQTMKLMLFAYISQSRAFYLMTEKEVAQGYCDLLLGLRGRAAASKYAWIIEAKYVASDATEAAIEKVTEQGLEQIAKYTADKDLVQMLTVGHFLKAGVLVFVGVKDVRYRAAVLS